MLGSTPTRSSDIRRVLGEWLSPTNRATLQPSRRGLSSSSMGRLTRGWVVRLRLRLEADLTLSLTPRWRWSPTYWTTSSVTSVREGAVGESLLHSSVRTSLVFRWGCEAVRLWGVYWEWCLFSTTVSSAGPPYTAGQAGSSTNLSSRRELTGPGRCPSAGVRRPSSNMTTSHQQPSLVNFFFLTLSLSLPIFGHSECNCRDSFTQVCANNVVIDSRLF